MIHMIKFVLFESLLLHFCQILSLTMPKKKRSQVADIPKIKKATITQRIDLDTYHRLQLLEQYVWITGQVHPWLSMDSLIRCYEGGDKHGLIMMKNTRVPKANMKAVANPKTMKAPVSLQAQRKKAPEGRKVPKARSMI